MIIRRKIDLGVNEFRHGFRNNNAVSRWEKQFSDFLGVKNARVVPSGRAGLKNILKSMTPKTRDELIIPAYTLKDLLAIIRSTGFSPIVADIDKNSLNIDPKDIENKITKRTRAILATHMFGAPCKIDEIMKVARRHHLQIIEDCAHSIGSKFNEKQTGSFGDSAFFSFENIKPINTYGGGMVVTRNHIPEDDSSNTLKVIKKMITARIENTFVHSPLSYPVLSLLATNRNKMKRLYRIVQGTPSSSGGYASMQASIGLRKLKTLRSRIEKRKSLARVYYDTLKIKSQSMYKGSTPNYYFFVSIYSGNTLEAKKKLLKKGIDVGILDEITDNCARILGKDCPNTEYVYEHALQLPMHEGLTVKQIKYIADSVNQLR